MKRFLAFIWEIAKIVVVALVIVIPIRYFLFQPFFVKGQSMEPNFENGDYLIVDEITYRFRSPQRGEVVVFKYPQNTSQRFIKRVIGLPGETVEIKDGKITVYQADSNVKILDESGYLFESIPTPGEVKITLGPEEYFVLGDNRPASYDSRRWGVLPEADIIGRVYLRAFPFATIAIFEAPAY